MSVIVYGVYDSTDAAEFAARKINRMVNDAKVTGISQRVLPDHSEETTIYAFPVNAGGSWPADSYAPLFSGSVAASVRDSNFEPARREDVNLRVEARNADSAQLIMSIMRNQGGRDIHQVKAKASEKINR